MEILKENESNTAKTRTEMVEKYKEEGTKGFFNRSKRPLNSNFKGCWFNKARKKKWQKRRELA
jgi:hypothetical protein